MPTVDGAHVIGAATASQRWSSTCFSSLISAVAPVMMGIAEHNLQEALALLPVDDDR
ncbi:MULTISPECIES: hypothetical protein [Streptacidiphilus]|uniref:Uncharacterized protein n=1 Tax=Streptacidiphilus cavernicola TaxID=3342716 RepID=A0ABV6UXC2_9ACTN|nr:hypothetical protein [Streptacidiphilus jeojiense]